MIVVDTSVWIDFFADRPTPQVAYLSGILDSGDDEIALTDIILTEILQGLRNDREVRRVDERLSVFEVLQLRDLADFRRAAALYRSTRQQGVTVRRSSDCLIASICVREEVPLLHADADFDHLARLTELSVVPLGDECHSYRRQARLRAEAERLRNDPEDVAASRRLNADMQSLRGDL